MMLDAKGKRTGYEPKALEKSQVGI